MFSSTSNLTTSLSSWFKDVSETLQGPPTDANVSKEQEEIKSEDPSSSNDQEEKTPADNGAQPEASTEKITSDEGEDKKPDGEEGQQQPLANLTQSVLNMNPEEVQKKLTEETHKMMSSAMSFGNFLYGVASDATKKVSSQVTVEKLQEIRKTVEEKTMLADFNRTQKEFIQTKREKEGDLAQPPWYGHQEEEKMKTQILALSTDSRNFLRSPPSGVQFQFDFQHSFPVAKATLDVDENLQKMRFNLVPTKVSEEVFWRNYFYRVSLIKQSAQLATLTDLNNKSSGQDGSSPGASSSSSFDVIGSTATGTTPLSRSSSSKSVKSLNNRLADDNTTDDVPTANSDDDLQDGGEFASDAYDTSNLNPDDLEREMRELGMKDDDPATDAIPEWEKELQKELQDYEVVDEDPKDEFWEEEIQNMLNDEK